VTLDANRFFNDSSGTAFVNNGGALTSATCSWWGDASGPLAATPPNAGNPGGLGDEILGTGAVSFSPWAVNVALGTVNGWPDADGDGFGDAGAPATQFCGLPLPAGFVDNDLDCNDLDALTFPGAPELCDGLDNDCDSVVPATEIDDDGDGFAECEGDCDDTEILAFPGNPEVCGDGIDNNCDGNLDSGTRYVESTGDDFPLVTSPTAPGDVALTDLGKVVAPNGQTRYISAIGSGTVADPYIAVYEDRNAAATARIHITTSTTGRDGFADPGTTFSGSAFDPTSLFRTHAKIVRMSSGNVIMYGCTSGANCRPLRYTISTDDGSTWSPIADVLAPNLAGFGNGGGIVAVWDDGTDVYLYEQGGGGDIVVTKSDPSATGEARYYTFEQVVGDTLLAIPASAALPGCGSGWSPTGKLVDLGGGNFGLFHVAQCDNGLQLSTSTSLTSGWTLESLVLPGQDLALTPPREDLREATVVADDTDSSKLAVLYTAKFGGAVNDKRFGYAGTNVSLGAPGTNDCTVEAEPCETVQHAVDQACDGDAVVAGAGNYAERVDIDKPLTLLCAQAGVPATDVSRVPGGPLETTIDGGGGGGAAGAVIDITVGGVAVDGCDIVGDGSTFAGILMFNDSANISGVDLDNNLIHDILAVNPSASFQQARALGIFAVMGVPGARTVLSGLRVDSNRVFSIGQAGGLVGGSGVYLNHVVHGTIGAGATIRNNSFEVMYNGPTADKNGSGVAIDAGDDNPPAPSSGVLIEDNTYAAMALGVGVFATDSVINEDNPDFAGVGCFVLNVDTSPFAVPFAAVDEPALVPYARSNFPTGFGLGSHLYCPSIPGTIASSDPGATISVVGSFVDNGIIVDKALTIAGSGCGGTVVDGGGSGVIFTIKSSDVTFADLTIQNGSQGARLEVAGTVCG